MATIKRKPEEMTALVKAWRSSAETKQSFCARQNITLPTFNYWIEKARNIDNSGSFIEVKGGTEERCVEFIFPQGAVLRLGSELSMSQVSLLKTLLY